MKYNFFKIKDVDIEGNDDKGYRFLIWDKKPVIIKIKNTESTLKKGKIRYTGYFDISKEELINYINNAISKDKKVLELEINYGLGIKEDIYIPKKYYKKIINQLSIRKEN